MSEYELRVAHTRGSSRRGSRGEGDLIKFGRVAVRLLAPTLVVAAGGIVAVWLATAGPEQLGAASQWSFVVAGIGAVFVVGLTLSRSPGEDEPRRDGRDDGPESEPSLPGPPDEFGVIDWETELEQLLAEPVDRGNSV